MASFNLLTEPWISVINKTGGYEELGIIETLVRAHELESLFDPAPPMEFGMYRFLIAFVMDAFELRDLDSLATLFDEGSFDLDRIDTYLDMVGRTHFDLFHPEHPFMQPWVREQEDEESACVLFQHLSPSLTNPHFNHIIYDEQAISPAICARALMTLAPFATQGGRGYSPSINGAPPWYVLVLGENLFETILLNCCVLPNPELDWDEPPAWRSAKNFQPQSEVRCRSILEGLTWCPRSIRLIASSGGICTYTGRFSSTLIREVYFSYGLKHVGEWRDPQAAYIINRNNITPLRPQENKELWRDIGPMLLLHEADYQGERNERYRRPIIIDQYYELINGRYVSKSIKFGCEVYGIRTKQMKIFEWYKEKLALPVNIIKSPNTGMRVQYALGNAEIVAELIEKALKKAYPQRKRSSDQIFKRLIQAMQQDYWSSLKPIFEQEFLETLASLPLDEPEAYPILRRSWKERLCQHGRQILDRYLDPLDANAAELRRQVAAWDEYENGIYIRLLARENH